MYSKITDDEFRKLDYNKVAKKRIHLLKQLREDKKKLQAVKVYYRKHPVDFINDWFITYDPRRQPNIMPFILFPKQRDLIQFFIDQLEGQEDGLVEKSRDMGVTWIAMAFSVWMWCFIPGAKISFGSRKQELVDRLGDPDSIFEKGRLILRYVPEELLPDEFDTGRHLPFLKLINPVTGSTITGEAGDQIGRGGRSTMYFKDESAFYEHPEKIESALSQNTDVQIDISTPNGPGNPFYQKRTGGQIPVFTFHWKNHPLKTQEWYDNEKRKRSPIIVAQELDIDYMASVENVCIPAKWIRAAVDLDIPDAGSNKASLDVADEGGDDNVFMHGKGVVIKLIIDWKEGNTTQTARKTYSLCRDNKDKVLNYDSIGVGAGVKGEMSVLPLQKIKLYANPVNVGASPTDDYFEDYDRENKDMFLNLKAELWWKLRRRFEKTYEYVNKINKKHKHDDLISIPDHQKLINELSLVKYKHAENGKIRIESKDSLRRRGIPSPNFADALVLYFAENPNFFRVTVV